MSYNLSELRELNESAKKSSKKDAAIIGLAIGASVPLAIVGWMVIVPAALIIAGLGAVLTPKSDRVYEADEDEVKETCKEINEVADKLINKQKSSRYNKLVYSHHKYSKFGTYKGNKFVEQDPVAVFNSGKEIYPTRTVLYFSVDTMEAYKELVEKAPRPGKEYLSDDKNIDYYNDIQWKTQDEMYSDLIELGFCDPSTKRVSSKSDKYSHVDIWWKDTADGNWVVVRPNTGFKNFIKKKDSSVSALSKLRDLGNKK